jgi:hypothetical protein
VSTAATARPPAAPPAPPPQTAAPQPEAAVTAPAPAGPTPEQETPNVAAAGERTERPTTTGATAERVEVDLDQETFDRVLAEELGKGTNRRVAEGKARRAALIAARKKAQEA